MLSYRYSTVPINKFRSGIISVVDPNTLNLDPDPEFWPNFVPNPNLGSDPGLLSILKEKFKNFRVKLFSIHTTKNRG